MTISGGNILSFYPSTWIGGGFRDFWFDDSPPVSSLRTITYSSEESLVTEDRVYTRSVGSDSVTDYIWDYNIPGYTKTIEEITRSSSNSGLLVPDEVDPYKWNYVGSGTVDITLSCPSRTKTVQVTTLNITGSNVSFSGYVSGSLREHINSGIDAAISGKSTANMNLFSYQNHTSAVYTRDTGCWASHLDLTPME